MLEELEYSITTYPGLYALWFVPLASWTFAIMRIGWRLAHARPVSRTRHFGGRLWCMLRDSLVQIPIWRLRLGGIMHLSLFWGGVLLLSGFVLSHYLAPRGVAWRKSGWIHLLNDLGVSLFLAGLGIAAWRRHVRRQVPAGVEDVALWAFLVVGVLLAWLSNALVVAVVDPRWGGLVHLSSALGSTLERLSLSTRRSLYGWSWSVFHAWLWGVAVIGPWCKWRHVLLAPLSLLTRRSAPLAHMDDLDLGREEPWGARRLVDLTWKERLDLEACTRCGRCTRVCPAHEAGRSLDPLELIERLQGGHGRGPLSEQVGESALWNCTTCMACDDVCPVGISPLSMILDLRRERVLDAAAFPRSLHRVFSGLERRGNPWGSPQGGRLSWVESLGLRVVGPGEGCDVLVWLGCMGAYDEGAKKAVRALVRVLDCAGVDLGTLGSDEGCCGDAARRVGNERLWREAARANIDALSARDIRRIVSLCPHCVNSLVNEYVDLGARLNATHATTLLSELLREGRLSLRSEEREGHRELVTYHDPCYLGRGIGAYQAARALIRALPWVELVEMPHRERDAVCCGAGGGQMWLEEPGKAPLANVRAREVAEVQVAVCATACPYCASMLSDSLAGAGDGTAVRDVVELIADALPESC